MYAVVANRPPDRPDRDDRRLRLNLYFRPIALPPPVPLVYFEQAKCNGDMLRLSML